MIVAIEKAQPVDAPLILALQKRAFQSEALLYGNFEIAPLQQTIEEMVLDFSNYTFLKALSQGIIAGSVKTRIVDGKCWVGRLIVEPDLRRNGIGTQLLKAVESNMPHVTEYFLFTGSESKGNIVLYEKAGYVVNGQTVEDHGVTLVGMSKINLGYKTAG